MFDSEVLRMNYLIMISSDYQYFVNISALQNFFIFCLKTDDLILVRILYPNPLPIIQSPSFKDFHSRTRVETSSRVSPYTSFVL